MSEIKKNEKIATLNIKLKDMFFKWINITQGFHKLNNQQQQILSLLLYHHYLLKKEVTNPKILWKVLFDYDTRLKIREDELFGEKGLSVSALNNAYSTFRSRKVIINGEISPVYIPELTRDCKNFKVIFNFNIVDNG